MTNQPTPEQQFKQEFQEIVAEAMSSPTSEVYTFSVPDDLFDNLEEEQDPSKK